jgi:hypothetical protein
MISATGSILSMASSGLTRSKQALVLATRRGRDDLSPQLISIARRVFARSLPTAFLNEWSGKRILRFGFAKAK